MNRKEVFLKCQQCINDIQTAANSKTFIKYRKEQITLRYFFVRNRQMLSVIQTDADMVPVLHFVFLTNDIRAVPVYMYQLLPGDFPFTVPPPTLPFIVLWRLPVRSSGGTSCPQISSLTSDGMTDTP